MSIATATQLQYEQLRDAAAVVDTLSQELSQGTRRYSADWYADVDLAVGELAGVLSDIFDLPEVEGTGSVQGTPRYMLESLRDTSRRAHTGVQPFAQGDRSRFQPDYMDALDATCLECYATIQDIRGQFRLRWSGLPVYIDVEGTQEAAWGDPVGLIKDSTGNGSDFTQPTVTARPILRESETGIAYLDFDGTDDLLSATLPAISGGTLVLATDKGIWIDGDFSFDGGSFDIGPGTYSGGPSGLLGIIGNPLVGGAFVIDRQLTTAERAQVVAHMQSIGSPGLIELGPELLVNGDFSDGFDGWTLTGSEPERWSVSDGVATIAVGTNPSAYIRQANATEGGLPHLITVDIVSSNGVGNIRAGGGSDNQHYFQLVDHPVGEVSAAFVSGGVQPNFFQVNALAETQASMSSISLREVILP